MNILHLGSEYLSCALGGPALTRQSHELPLPHVENVCSFGKRVMLSRVWVTGFYGLHTFWSHHCGSSSAVNEEFYLLPFLDL